MHFGKEINLQLIFKSPSPHSTWTYVSLYWSFVSQEIGHFPTLHLSSSSVFRSFLWLKCTMVGSQCEVNKSLWVWSARLKSDRDNILFSCLHQDRWWSHEKKDSTKAKEIEITEENSAKKLTKHQPLVLKNYFKGY